MKEQLHLLDIVIDAFGIGTMLGLSWHQVGTKSALSWHQKGSQSVRKNIPLCQHVIRNL